MTMMLGHSVKKSRVAILIPSSVLHRRPEDHYIVRFDISWNLDPSCKFDFHRFPKGLSAVHKLLSLSYMVIRGDELELRNSR